MTADILVVDDDPVVRRTLIQMIREHGEEAAAAASGEEALVALSRTPFRLVLTDVRLPGMSGLDLLREVRARYPQIGVVLVSGFGSVEMAVEAMQEGALDFLLKPFDLARVAEVLERTLGARPSRTRPSVSSLAGIVSQDPRMLGLLETVARIAPSPALGEV